MKLRKHLNNKRLEKLTMVGNDRIADLQFGTGEAEHHLIVELYDKGNLFLTDKDLVIINVLRPRVQGEDKFLVRETYSADTVSALLHIRSGVNIMCFIPFDNVFTNALRFHETSVTIILFFLKTTGKIIKIGNDVAIFGHTLPNRYQLPGVQQF
jgi:hypothetical protein